MADHVQLLEEDPDLGAGLEPAALQEARRVVGAREWHLPRGAWSAQAEFGEPRDGWLGLFLMEGFVLRSIQCRDERSSELLGAGDVIRPWDHDGDYPLESISTHWTVLVPVRLALLDAEFTRRAARWPPIGAALVERIGRRARWLAVRLTISHLGRVDARVLYLIWHLADRWGHVTREGFVVPGILTHAQVAELIGARRPSVTSAVGELRARGAIEQRADGSWLLPLDTPERLDALMRE